MGDCGVKCAPTASHVTRSTNGSQTCRIVKTSSKTPKLPRKIRIRRLFPRVYSPALGAAAGIGRSTAMGEAHTVLLTRTVPSIAGVNRRTSRVQSHHEFVTSPTVSCIMSDAVITMAYTRTVLKCRLTAVSSAARITLPANERTATIEKLPSDCFVITH